MPSIRLVLNLGLPDPDRFSTMILVSLLGHLGLGVGMLIYQALPSETPAPRGGFFVKLAGSGGPRGAAQSSGAAEAGAPAPPAPVAPPSPPVVKEEPAPRRREPDKASLLAEKAAKKPAPARAVPRREAAEKPSSRAAENESEQGGPSGSGHGAEGSGSAPAGAPGTGSEGGVGGTSFGEGDFQYAWYQSAIESKLRSAWRRPAAGSGPVQAVTVSFTISRSGAVKEVQVTAPSGSSTLDLSVLRAVYDSNPLPALPRSWSGDSVHVSMEFRLTPGAP